MKNSIDLELKLLSDDPIMVGSVPVHKIPFRLIARIGLSKVMYSIRLLTMCSTDIVDMFGDEDINTLMAMLFVLNKADAALFALVCDVIEIVFGSTPTLITPDRLMFDKFEINSDNWLEVTHVIRARNEFGNHVEENADNPADEATRQLIERRNALRKVVAKKKGNDDMSITLIDLVGIFAVVTGLPLSQVMEYDVYQLYNQFSRYQMYEQYQVQIEALLHGAKNEDVELKHYARKLGSEN